MNRPLLLLDIDGVISLFGFDHRRPPAGRFVFVDGIAHFLSGQAADQVRALAPIFELAWCSGWEEKADEYLPFALDLPQGLSHVRLEPREAPGERHWKLAAIDRFVGPQRPVAWVDDAHDESCRLWAQARSARAPTLLIGTDPAVGLIAEQAAELRAWAAGIMMLPDLRGI